MQLNTKVKNEQIQIKIQTGLFVYPYLEYLDGTHIQSFEQFNTTTINYVVKKTRSKDIDIERPRSQIVLEYKNCTCQVIKFSHQFFGFQNFAKEINYLCKYLKQLQIAVFQLTYQQYCIIIIIALFFRAYIYSAFGYIIFVIIFTLQIFLIIGLFVCLFLWVLVLLVNIYCDFFLGGFRVWIIVILFMVLFQEQKLLLQIKFYQYICYYSSIETTNTSNIHNNYIFYYLFYKICKNLNSTYLPNQVL
eukprot:TRINITY_DN6624_c0_g1_i5.p1 TRINITY_DN6624_c0_g1~~TRINITY_DN6624_c0_g1_i5.p1  ORF type:complete len:247 (-),score=-22.98 TRINITY_DN6624_c0_g1_i5:512-1252(-)